MKPQIIPMGGAALPEALDNLLLIEYFARQTGKRSPRVCFIAAASGDVDEYIVRFYAGFNHIGCRPAHLPLFKRTPRALREFVLGFDAIFVGGGNTRSMLAVFREWKLDRYLREAWRRGIVLGGASAGAICWFEDGLTDSVAGPLTRMRCLGLLAGGCAPHYDSEPARRPTLHRLVGRGTMRTSVAADDGVALHYVGTRLVRAVSARGNARAYRVTRSRDGVVEQALPTRLLGAARNNR
ncbi:MAG TPA: peptidase E [Burkholderiales bacterium]|nr:peptidase E [Burkholderiales bacterium]